ncbi:Mmp37 domain-containing protein [Rhizoctonia solani AG-1 IA]|uniref:Phosphatidate cytidylyltransferase, mitochondrial n=1 Tax=Thanatephorus cucumeris (strain AG1-IA) TaxID=983506 RepID=L8X737_THACA|nr:Mmp37 domain-containing protein [Rhizoctonia solani AG-1 IA]
MLSTPTRSVRTTFASQARALSYTASVKTPQIESHSSQPSHPPPHYAPQSSSQSPGSPAPRRSRLSSPAPRPTPAMQPGIRVPLLPPQFGRNQVLAVPDRTRALLEEIVAGFDAPIRYAFAYGSGVFGQEGYKDSDRPQLDFLFAVTHADHFHSINMQQNSKHYALVPRLLGSDFVAPHAFPIFAAVVDHLNRGACVCHRPRCIFLDEISTHADISSGVTIKYGVTTVDNLCADLLGWKSLYMAGRMHKPIRIIKDDPRVRLTQQVNLTSAVRAALLTLPERFNEKELFERIAGISDPRMSFAENPHKVRNIVNAQQEQFRELYHRLVVGLPGVHWVGEKVEVRITIHSACSSSVFRSAWLERVLLIGWVKTGAISFSKAIIIGATYRAAPTVQARCLRPGTVWGKGITRNWLERNHIRLFGLRIRLGISLIGLRMLEHQSHTLRVDHDDCGKLGKVLPDFFLALQDASPQARGLLLRKLPSNLRTRIDTRYQSLSPEPAPASPSSSPTRDENVFWQRIGAAPDLSETMQVEMADIIKGPATMQSVKGLVTAGPIKSLKYAGEKIGKWWNSLTWLGQILGDMPVRPRFPSLIGLIIALATCRDTSYACNGLPMLIPVPFITQSRVDNKTCRRSSQSPLPAGRNGSSGFQCPHFKRLSVAHVLGLINTMNEGKKPRWV